MVEIDMGAATELSEGQALGRQVRLPDGRVLALILVRWQGRVRAWENRCPHTGVNLEWLSDQFFDPEGRHLQCATHGALFRPDDGYCIFGPCAGQSLTPVRVLERAGRIILETP